MQIAYADFPRAKARTRGFTLGRPRSLTVAPHGDRVLFLRSPAGDDPVHALWGLEVGSGEERLLAAPADLIGENEELSEEERRRRERAREQSSGIVSYTTDAACTKAVYLLSGRVFVTDVATGRTQELEVVGPAFGPRIDPTGTRVAYVADGDLYVTPLDGPGSRIVGEEDPDVTWGLAEFVAAEEMSRSRGFWWSPDGERLVAAQVDNRPVDDWYISDPAHPDVAPTRVAYPAAGTTNAEVGLAVFAATGQQRVDVVWDRGTFPYLGRVVWQEGHPLTLEVVTRRQDRIAVLTVDPDSGAVETVAERSSAAWVELIEGAPRWLDGERLATVEDVTGDEDTAGTRRIVIDGVPATPPQLQVDRLIGTSGAVIWFLGTDDAQQMHVHTLDADSGEVTRVSQGTGWFGAAHGGGTVALGGDDAREGAHGETPGVVAVRRGADTVATIGSHAHDGGLHVEVRHLELGARRLPASLTLPVGAGDEPLPVLLSPYGGPHAAARSRRSRLAHLEKQWFAEQGFAVLVIDGRGTPHRGPSWEQALRLDLAAPVLEDQVDGLHAAAKLVDRLDLSRVAIRGWSFGGFLAALAVLRRPDIFHAAVVGAPVTDWHLYDTYYTERYLGLPQEQPEAYRRSSLVDGDGALVGAVAPPGGRHPGMLLIHGLADDNVVAAHTLRLSAALLADGRPHEVLPLTGVTHMTPQAVVAENLLRVEIDFLRRHLGAPAG